MKDNKFVIGLLLGLTFFLFMGATFTRDWIESTPTNSTVANQIDDFNRYLRVDASDRLKEMIYGFINGENSGYPGFKELIFKQQSSAPGTTNADEITLYSIDDGSNCGLYAIQEDGYTKQLLKKVGSDINFVIETADIPADVIDSVHYAANSIDPEHLVDDFTFDTFPLSPSSAPDANYELANKKYVDDQVTAAKTAVGWVHDGSTTINLTTLTTTYQDVNTGIGGRGIVFLKIKSTQSTLVVFVKTKGESDTPTDQTAEDVGCSGGKTSNGKFVYVWCETDTNGYVQAIKIEGTNSNVTITVMGYLLTP